MKVKINEWTAIGVWKWKDFGDEVCGICRVQFEGTCPECIYPGEGCPPVKGRCSHAFHRHCIKKWVEIASSERLCPMCRQPWRAEENPNLPWTGDGRPESTEYELSLIDSEGDSSAVLPA